MNTKAFVSARLHSVSLPNLALQRSNNSHTRGSAALTTDVKDSGASIKIVLSLERMARAMILTGWLESTIEDGSMRCRT